MKNNVICESISLFVLLIVLVRKKDNLFWLCVDYRKLNDKIIKDKFLLFRVEEIFDVFYGFVMFFIMDFILGYN